jgi:single-stranded-DNA-specific exonuclease
VRSRAVSFGCDGRLPVEAGVPADATFRLERNEWNGAVEPRLLLRSASACAPAPIELLGEPAADGWLTAVLAEVDRLREAAPRAAPAPATDERAVPAAAEPAPAARAAGTPEATAARTVIDRRGDGGAAVLADLLAGEAEVLAVCADVSRRIGGLRERIGGFALCSHAALERAPQLAERFAHVVVLDPPAHADQDVLLRAGGPGTYVHWAWSHAELRFAEQIHASEYDIRASLVPLYRTLRDDGSAAGEELERLLRGDGPHSRSAWHAARLVAVLEELGLVSLDRDLPALAVASAERTELERSAVFRAAMQRHEDGLRFLRTATPAART